jgi:hypothetical protein
VNAGGGTVRLLSNLKQGPGTSLVTAPLLSKKNILSDDSESDEGSRLELQVKTLKSVKNRLKIVMTHKTTS